MDSRKYKAQVDADLAQAKSLGVRGTPNFFINGKKPLALSHSIALGEDR